MDRYDERKPLDVDDEAAAEAQNTQFGDVLGLGGSAVPKMPGDPSASYDPKSVEQRRERALSDETSESPTVTERSAGATGVDMGAGGTGTGLSGE
jgi:hypothetical protein